jgi:tyrosyl-tRNA synthetase
MDINERYALITRNLQEVIGEPDEIKKILSDRPLKIYWGTAATSRIHVAYYVQMLKIADYLQAGCEVTILIADLHAFLDNMKSSFELINHRAEYYKIVIQTMLTSMGVSINRLKFVKGTDFQLSDKYTLDMYKANSFITCKAAQHAGAEVVKQSDNPMMNGLLYPTLQALDEEYLGIDASTCGVDQRKILIHSKIIMPKLGYKKRMHFMTKMVSGLRTAKKEEKKEIISTVDRSNIQNLLDNTPNDNDLINKLQNIINEYNKPNDENIADTKMSASNPDSKIDLLDTKKQIVAKINKCYCLPGDIVDNCLIEILENLIFPILNYKGLNFVINRKDKFGGPITYTNINEVKRDFVTEVEGGEFKLHPGDLKLGVSDSLEEIVRPIREEFAKKDMQQLLKLAYPS